jgi:hypothetical protein
MLSGELSRSRSISLLLDYTAEVGQKKNDFHPNSVSDSGAFAERDHFALRSDDTEAGSSEVASVDPTDAKNYSGARKKDSRSIGHDDALVLGQATRGTK